MAINLKKKKKIEKRTAVQGMGVIEKSFIEDLHNIKIRHQHKNSPPTL